MNSIQALLISAIGVFFYVLEILIFVRILFSWLPFGVGYNSSIGRLLYQLTEPILGPVRNPRSAVAWGLIFPLFLR